MSVSISLKFRTEDIERNIAKLQERAPFAIARALNRSAASAKTLMVRHVASDTGLKVSDVREQIVVEEARPGRGDLVARVSVSGKRIPLIAFNAKGPEPSRGRGRGVSARLPGGAGRYPNAFIATMRSGPRRGHRGVFQRRSTARLPIYELYGPSLPHVFGKYVADGMARGEEQLHKNLAHELRFALSQVA